MQEKLIVFFPDYSGGNPYQKLLYQPCQAAGWKVVAGGPAEALEQAGSAGQLIFHVHWLNAIFKDCVSALDAWQATYRFMQELDQLRAKGAKLMWTIHNHLPHENPFSEQDLRVRHYLCKFSDRIHLHCVSHIDELNYLPLSLSKVSIHRHGSYIGYYGGFSVSQRLEELKKRKLKALFLGSLRSYKAIDSLVDTVKDLVSHGIELTIAGRPESDEIHTQIESLNSLSGVTTILRRLTEKEVGELCSQHNVGILSYDKILTSGTLKLYLSYGMVVVAPNLPTITYEDRYDSFLKISDAREGIGALVSSVDSETLAKIAAKNYFLAQESRWSADLFSFDLR